MSLPENGRDPRWGLSGVGQQQAAAAGRQLAAALAAEPGYAPEQLLVLASPFSRTLQTAECAGLALGLAPGDARLQVCREGGPPCVHQVSGTASLLALLGGSSPC